MQSRFIEAQELINTEDIKMAKSQKRVFFKLVDIEWITIGQVKTMLRD